MRNPLALLALFLGCVYADSVIADGPTFEKDIRPIFRQHCFDCHGAEKNVKGKLDLRLVRLMAKGGESGAAIVKGKPSESYLLQRIKSGEMPPGDHPVSPKQIALLEKWIAAGAPTARPEPASIGPGLGVTPEERAYWVFQPIRRPAVPSVKDASRVRTPIDAFLIAQMEKKQLKFAADADRTTLIRRAYLDLLGVPPTPGQVAAFVNDKKGDAWPRLIDELLRSPLYGERWGRHWLDVAGYADSEGYSNRDDVRTWAYKYRDWVIRAHNQDQPFDEFVRWQLAGDELVAPPYKNMSPEAIDKLTATGFLRMAADGTGASNNDEARNRVMTDTIKIVSSSLLGLSVGCAQCHDHRYDPISQEDYYRLRAVLEPGLDYKNWKVPSSRRLSLYTDADIAKSQEVEKEASKKVAERNKKQSEFMEAALQTELKKYAEDQRKPLETAYKTAGNKRTDAQKALLKKNPNIASLSPGVLYQYNQGNADKLKAMDKEIAAIRSKKPPEEFLRALTESGKVPATKLFYRGDYRQPQQDVLPGGLTVASPAESPLAIHANRGDMPSTGRRLAYARWLTSGRHPLVARVLINRFWLNHFGQTFVSTPDEFGKLGTLPTHPKLLDWLADEFMAKGWSLKAFHRLVMTSTVYMQKSSRTPHGDQVDGSNSLFAHFPVRRLDAEAIRDSILAVSGRLDPKQFGPATAVSADDAGQYIIKGDKQRRSIYLQMRRTQPIAILKSFDAPAMEVNCASRSSSTVATQALMLMNSGFILDFSKAFAERLNREAGDHVAESLVKNLKIDVKTMQLIPQNPWRYGYGFLPPADEGSVAKVKFTSFPYFGSGQWSGGPKLPDPKLGYVLINASGGHPQSKDKSSIRRWVSPVSGMVQVEGDLHHGSNNGDGVKLTLHSSRLGVQGVWKAKAGNAKYSVKFPVEKGDHIDAIVSENDSNASDSYTNRFTIRLADPKAPSPNNWSSEKEFHGPLKTKPGELVSSIAKQVIYGWQLAYGRTPSDEESRLAIEFIREQLVLLKEQKSKTPVQQAITNYCQILLSSNEFLYID